MSTSSTNKDGIGDPVPHVVQEDSGVLRRYGKLRLDLAEVIRSVLERARESKDEDLEARARKLMVRLSEDRFYLAVLGQHKRGKSSLMNAMVGLDLLPTGILPVTSAIVALKYDSALKVQVHVKSWSYPKEIPLAELPDYVSEQGNPGNRKQVISAEVGVPADLLRSGFYFVDTPGVGSAIAANTATTEAFLPEADAAIFVTSFESPMNELELSFLDQIRQYVRKIFFVINKSDLVSAAEREQVTAFVRQRVADRVGQTDFRLYAVSANAQLAAVRRGNSASGDPGLEVLRHDLKAFLFMEKTREFLMSVARRARQLLEYERLQANLVQWTSGTPGANESAKAAIGRAADELIQTARRTIRELGAAVALEIEERFASVYESFRDAQMASATESLKTLFYQSDVFFSPFDVPDQLNRLRLSRESTASEWLSEHSSEFDGVVHNAAAPQAARLAALAPGVLAAAAEGLGLNVPNDGNEMGEGPDSIAEFRLSIPARAPTFSWGWRLPWWCFLLPAPWVENWAMQQALRTLHGTIERYEKTLREFVVFAGKCWLDGLTVSVESTIRRRADHIKGTLAGQARRDASRQIESDLRRIEAMAEDLEGQNGGVAVPDSEATIADSTANQKLLKPCVLCRELAAALSSFMSGYQYDLATDHDCQLSHAQSGGFCPLHTWVYESIASPQGVSTGYPPTLDQVSNRLRSVAAVTPATLRADEVARAISNPERCPACRMLDNAERDLIAKHAQSIRQQLRPSLCLPHAQHVLRVVVDEQSSRELILDQVSVIERIAEDMRLYALRTDAIQSHLMVADEKRAFRRGLAQLAGEKNLAIARRVD